MPEVEEGRRLLERIDERQIAFKEGFERLREDVETTKETVAVVKGKQDALSDGNLERYIDARITIALEKKGVSAREWIGIGIALIAVLVAYFHPAL